MPRTSKPHSDTKDVKGSVCTYEMVCNFNNFKAFVMFAVKVVKPCLSCSKFFEYAYVSPENFF